MYKVTSILLLLLFSTASADQLHHEFGNPSFSGNGYSQHVLSIEQLQYSRKNDVKDEAKSAAAAAERLQNNTTINKFIKNVESRIYANLSKQLVDNMFGESQSTSGTFELEGNIISYSIEDGMITLTIIAADGTETIIQLPLGDFSF